MVAHFYGRFMTGGFGGECRSYNIYLERRMNTFFLCEGHLWTKFIVWTFLLTN